MIEGSSMSDEEYYHLNGALSAERIEGLLVFKKSAILALAALEEFINTFDDEVVVTAVEPALDLLRGEGET